MSDVLLRPGHLVALDGLSPEPSHVVDYVNDSRARCSPLKGGRVHVITPLVGQPKVVEDKPDSVNVATVLPGERVVGWIHPNKLNDYLTEAAARRKERRQAASQSKQTEAENMKTEKRRARGGLAATVTSNGTTDKPRRGRPPGKAKAPKAEEAPAAEAGHSKGKLGEVMGHSVCKVIRRLALEGCSAGRIKAICEARGLAPAENTVKLNRSAALRAKDPAPAADLTKAQVKELLELAPEPEAAAKE
jgi:hypothetical protein